MAGAKPNNEDANINANANPNTNTEITNEPVETAEEADNNTRTLNIVGQNAAQALALTNQTKPNNTIKPNNKTKKRGFSNGNGNQTQKAPSNITNEQSNESSKTNESNQSPGSTTNVELPSENRTNNSASNESRKSLDRLAMNLLNHQVVMKLFHFQTDHYGAHKASDGYLEKFAGTMDRFLEIAQGIYGKVSIKKYALSGSSHTDENIIKHINGMITYLRTKIDDVLANYTDLINIRDELVGDIEQLKYLLTFK